MAGKGLEITRLIGVTNLLWFKKVGENRWIVFKKA